MTDAKAQIVNAITDRVALTAVAICIGAVAVVWLFWLITPDRVLPVTVEQCAKACIASGSQMQTWSSYGCMCLQPTTKGPTP